MRTVQEKKQPNPAVTSDGNNFPTINVVKKTVWARELYEFLQVESNFTTWCKRMLEYGFTEGKDFIPILEESKRGRPSTDYELTLDTAKEISMIQRSAKGKEARQYFIECERRFQAAKAVYEVYEKAETTPKVDAKGQMSLFDLPDTDIIRAQRLAMEVALQAKNGSKTAQLLRILTPYLFKNQGA